MSVKVFFAVLLALLCHAVIPDPSNYHALYFQIILYVGIIGLLLSRLMEDK